jgi:hypothetical protein
VVVEVNRIALSAYPDGEYAPELVWLDHAKLNVTREVKPREQFTSTFDFGDNWEHRCAVEREKADPVEEYGIVPSAPVPIWGWGWIPDQYGRRSEDGGLAERGEIAITTSRASAGR